MAAGLTSAVRWSAPSHVSTPGVSAVRFHVPALEAMVSVHRASSLRPYTPSNSQPPLRLPPSVNSAPITPLDPK
jgi:hypothetical protein